MKPKIDQNNILNLLGAQISPGESRSVNFITAALYTNTPIEVPVIVERSKEPGPTLLITAGIHGDEFNGVEIVRQLISKKINKPKIGTIICIPIVNVFGFLNMQRTFPDGRDLNRSFPGSKNGSLAARFAYQFVNEILPVADLCLDFHTGGAKRFNAPQIRLTKDVESAFHYAKIFNAPFTVYSKTIPKSYRAECNKRGIPYLIFEGGMAEDNNKYIAATGVNGIMRILKNLNMLRPGFRIDPPETESVIIKNTKWMRAGYSGLFHNKTHEGELVLKGQHIASITDPYGEFRKMVKAPNNGYIINVNYSPIVHKGEAIYHISSDS